MPRAQPARGFFVAFGTEKRLAMPSTVLVAGGCPHWGGPGWRLHSVWSPYAIIIKIIKILLLLYHDGNKNGVYPKAFAPG